MNEWINAKGKKWTDRQSDGQTKKRCIIGSLTPVVAGRKYLWIGGNKCLVCLVEMLNRNLLHYRWANSGGASNFLMPPRIRTIRRGDDVANNDDVANIFYYVCIIHVRDRLEGQRGIAFCVMFVNLYVRLNRYFWIFLHLKRNKSSLFFASVSLQFDSLNID